MPSDSVQESSVVAGRMSLRLGGRNYWYALLYSDPPAEEGPAYRHGVDQRLHAEQDAVVSDLGRDGIPIDAEMAGSVDVDRARALVGHEMSRYEIDVVINAWNALDDLFWGLNGGGDPRGRSCTPAWKPRELAKIDQVLRKCGSRIAPSS